MVTALTVIVFIIIAVLDQREKLQKKRLRHIEPASASSDGSIGEEIEKDHWWMRRMSPLPTRSSTRLK